MKARERAGAHRRRMEPEATLPHHRHLLSRLQREWDRLAISPSAIARARNWPLVIGRLDTLDDILRRTGYGRPSLSDSGDALLRDLVRVARSDQLAARIVLQRLLPGLSAMSRRRAVGFGSGLDALDEAVATACAVIRTFPVERRSRFVAAAMLHEIEYRAFQFQRRRKCEFVPTPAAVFEQAPAVDEPATPADELRALLADARRAGFAAEDIELAERLASGATADELAAERKVTPRTIRNHRAIVVHRLRQLALAPV